MYLSREQQRLAEEHKGDCPPIEEFLETIKDYGVPLASDILHNAYRRAVFGLKYDETSHRNFRYGDSYALVSGNLLRRLVKSGGSTSEKNLQEIYGINTKYPFDRSVYADLDSTYANQLMALDAKEVADYGLRRFLLNDFAQARPKFRYKSAEILWKIMHSEVSPFRSRYNFNYKNGEESIYGNCKDSEAYFLMAASENWSDMQIYTFENENNQPIIIQKGGNGTKSTTAINLVDLNINGIYVPRGTLLGIEHDYDIRAQVDEKKFPVSGIKSILPLRLTFWSIPRNEVEIAFQDHWRNFVHSFAPSYEHTELPTLEFLAQGKKELQL